MQGLLEEENRFSAMSPCGQITYTRMYRMMRIFLICYSCYCSKSLKRVKILVVALLRVIVRYSSISNAVNT